MIRDYDGVKSTASVTLFVGTEIEHTPAFGMRTLFVVGIQDVSTILDIVAKEKIEHVYFGANHSFTIDHLGDWPQFQPWDQMINAIRDLDLWITLDYDAAYHEDVLESGWNEYDRFISMISVKLPYIDQLNYNACLKLDDKTFRATNAGVWVHQVADLKQRSQFTNWSQYTNDKVIK